MKNQNKEVEEQAPANASPVTPDISRETVRFLMKRKFKHLATPRGKSKRQSHVTGSEAYETMDFICKKMTLTLNQRQQLREIADEMVCFAHMQGYAEGLNRGFDAGKNGWDNWDD